MSYYKGQTLYAKGDGSPMRITGVIGDDVFFESGAKIKNTQVHQYFNESPSFGAPDVSKYSSGSSMNESSGGAFDPEEWLTRGTIAAIQSAVYTPYHSVRDDAPVGRDGTIQTRVMDVSEDEIDHYELERLRREKMQSDSYNSMVNTSKKVISEPDAFSYDDDEDVDWLGNKKTPQTQPQIQPTQIKRQQPLNENGEVESIHERAERIKRERESSQQYQSNQNNPLNENAMMGSGDIIPRKQTGTSNRVPTQKGQNDGMGGIIGNMMLKRNHQFKVDLEYYSMIPDPNFIRIAIDNTDESIDLIRQLANEITDAMYADDQMLFDLIYNQLKNYIMDRKPNRRSTGGVRSLKSKVTAKGTVKGTSKNVTKNSAKGSTKSKTDVTVATGKRPGRPKSKKEETTN